MVEEQAQITGEVYASGKYNKFLDFFIGVGIFLGIGLVLSIIFGGLLFLINFLELNVLTSSLTSPMFIIAIALQIVGCVRIYKTYFQGRRLIKIGMWVVALTPLVMMLILLGACIINPPQW